MSYESTEVKLMKQEDWPTWFDFIQSEATTAKIWRFVDPGENTVPANVEPDVYYYTRDRGTVNTIPTGITGETSTQASESASTQPIDARLDQYLAGQDSGMPTR